MNTLPLESEKGLEDWVRNLINERISGAHPEIYALSTKKCVDIVICRDGERPAAFFLEIKYFRRAHGRLGTGAGQGGGWQPELLGRAPKYFESQMRWVLGSEDLPAGEVIFATSETLRKYLTGGRIGAKFNNIQIAIFSQERRLNQEQFVRALKAWLRT